MRPTFIRSETSFSTWPGNVFRTPVYLAENVPALLVLTSKAPSLVLLFPGERGQDRAKRPNVSSAGQESSRAPELGQAEGRFQILASWLTFSLEDREWTLKPKPWLLGVQDIPSMLKDNPSTCGGPSLTPDKTVVEHQNPALGGQCAGFLRLLVRVLQRHVPLMVKVAEQLQGSSVHRLPGLPQGWGQHPVAGPLQIRAVPTAVVSIGGKEVGRITGEKWKSPEVALKEILPKQ
jgi:hypothetical protein